MPLLLPVLQQALYGMMVQPSSDVAQAANRFGSAVETWAMGALAMGIPAVVPAGLIASGIMAAEPIPSIIGKFWASVVFPGAVTPPVGPPLPDAMVALSGDAAEASARFANALQINAQLHTVTFVVAGVPTVFPVM